MAQALDARRVAHGRCGHGDVAEDFVTVGVEAAEAEAEGAAGKSQDGRVALVTH